MKSYDKAGIGLTPQSQTGDILQHKESQYLISIFGTIGTNAFLSSEGKLFASNHLDDILEQNSHL